MRFDSLSYIRTICVLKEAVYVHLQTVPAALFLLNLAKVFHKSFFQNSLSYSLLHLPINLSSKSEISRNKQRQTIIVNNLLFALNGDFNFPNRHTNILFILRCMNL